MADSTKDKDAPAKAASDETGSRAVRGASLLVLLQVFSRAVTFIANQLLLRFMTAELLGVATQLEVFYLSVLFFARESLRVAIQRQGVDDAAPPAARDDGPAARQARTSQAVVNLAYIAVLLGSPLALLFGWLYLASVEPATVAAAPNLRLSLYLYGVAAVVELLSEPAFVVMQIRLQFAARASAESIATFLRCVVTLGSAVSAGGSSGGVLPFALGQTAYGLGLLAVYGWYGTSLARREGFSLLPRRMAAVAPNQYVLAFFYQPTLQLATSMMAQSLVKHVLTQGDTFLVSILSTPTAQGIYALANNYGGLAARLVFQPVEESSRSYFSRILAARPETATNTSADAGSGPDPQAKASATRASQDLQAILKVYTLLSLVIVTLGPTAAPLLLSLVAGPRWASAGSCLAAYMWYLPLLAINGVSEAFVASVATQSEVHGQSGWMTAFSLVFAAAGFVFLRVMDLGATGLVLANGINMLCRITWCGVFISRYFRSAGVPFGLSAVRPSPVAVLACAVTSAAVHRLANTGELAAARVIVELGKIAATAVPFLAVLAVTERKFLLDSYRTLLGKSKAE